MGGGTWAAELDAVVRRLDALPLVGRIVELRCGVGFWSVLLATKGELTAIDDRPAMLDRTRARLTAHRLRAHLHERDPSERPGPPDVGAYDAIVVAFALSQLPAPARAGLVAAALAWLHPAGRLVVIDLARPGMTPAELRDAAAHLVGAGFDVEEASTTGRHFVVISALARNTAD